MKRLKTLLVIMGTVLICMTTTAQAQTSNYNSHQSVSEKTILAYAKKAAATKGWTGSEWNDLVTMIGWESGWNPCKRYPQTTDCFYSGSNSCGIPQATPCPPAWRGRLLETWKKQVWWMLHYIEGGNGHFHTPTEAIAYHRTYGSY